jgi:23S rRNA pseudouridine1911/1915/1917 synthase
MIPRGERIPSRVASISVTLTVPDELAGQRLDVVIPRLAPQISRRQTRRLVEDGAVFVDGKRVQVCSRAVRGGARLEVALPSAAAERRPEVQVGLVTLDADLVVCDKPAGVPTEPTREGSRGTLLAALVDALKARNEDTGFLHAVHRLDTDTTGVVVFARSADAARTIGKQLHDGTAERRYLALVDGVPPWVRARLDQPLSRTRDAMGRVQVDPDGAPALTLATVLVPGTSGSLVLCAPRTGRTHQLRVHLAQAGHGLVGDRRYGRGRAPHLGLHALSLAAVHPGGQETRWCAPPPPAFFDAAASRGVPPDAVRAVMKHLAPELA